MPERMTDERLRDIQQILLLNRAFQKRRLHGSMMDIGTALDLVEELANALAVEKAEALAADNPP